ncbi:MAG: hypothetical protein ACJ76P_04895 [Actinomycetota bacterium]
MPKEKFVHARYTGDSPQVMPDLMSRDRCCKAKNQREDDPNGNPNPRALIEKGDVILLDRYSAEGRPDFELVEHSHKPTRKAPSEGTAPGDTKE